MTIKNLLKKIAGTTLLMVTVAVALLGSSIVQNSETQPGNIVMIVEGNNEVAVGTEYEAKFNLLSRQSKDRKVTVRVGEEMIEIEDGIGKFTTIPKRPGEKRFPVTITVKRSNTGEKQTYHSQLSFKAIKTHFTVSADRMNVLYRGLTNPVSISVAGIRPSRITAEMTEGRLKRIEPGRYVARVPEVNNTKIRVSATFEDGSKTVLGHKEFRVKPLPKPDIRFGTHSDHYSSFDVEDIFAIVANMPRGFAFEGVRYVVTHFRLIYVPKNGTHKTLENDGPRLTPKMKNLLKSARTGDKIIIDQVKVRGPSGIENLTQSETLVID